MGDENALERNKVMKDLASMNLDQTKNEEIYVFNSTEPKKK